MTRTHDEIEQTEQQIEQQPTEKPKDGGLTPEQELVLMQLATFDSNNAEALANALREHPEMREQILEFASSTLGNAVVQQALQLADRQFEAEQLGVMEQQQQDEQFMDRQIAEEQAQQTTLEASTAPAPEQVEKVEAVETMKPGDEEMLAATLTEAPEVRDEVIVKATEQLGTETVEAAIVTQSQEQQEVPPEVQVAPEPLPEQVVEQIVEEPRPADVEEAWVDKAREYNRRHAKMVDEFLELAGVELRLPDGTVDPTVIVAWQQANGVAVDGRIGPETVAAAREGAKKAAAAAENAVKPTEDANVASDPA